MSDYKVKPTKYTTDHADIMAYVSTYGELMRCAGGRHVANRYCCTLCGSVDPGSKCLSPKPPNKDK